MKKLLLLSVLLVLMTGFVTSAWALLMNEGFEGASFPPSEWSTAATAWESYTGYAYTGAKSCKSGYSPSGDWWLMTPLLRPEAGANTLTFWYRDYSSSSGWDYTDEYTWVMVSTTSNAPVAFTSTVWTGSYTTFTTTWQQASVDLSGYNGQNIFLAFKSYHSGGNYRIIDDVTGINFAPASIPPTPSAAINPLMDAINVPVNTDLVWSAAGGTPDGYRVYFDTASTPTTLVVPRMVTEYISIQPVLRQLWYPPNRELPGLLRPGWQPTRNTGGRWCPIMSMVMLSDAQSGILQPVQVLLSI